MVRVYVRGAVTYLLYYKFQKATRHRNRMKKKKMLNFVSENAAFFTETEKKYPW